VLFYEIKKDIYPYLKYIVYDKLLKLRQSFRITLYSTPGIDGMLRILILARIP